MVRLVYVADTQIPSRATNGIQVMRMCDAFAARGAEVTLVHPYRFGNRPEGLEDDAWGFYGIGPTFRRVTLPTPLTMRLSSHRRLARILRLPPLAAYILLRSLPGRTPFIAYGRSMLGLRLAASARDLIPAGACRAVVAELHDLPREKAAWDTLSRVDGVVTISAVLERDLLRSRSELEGRTRVEHDGFDPRLIDAAASSALAKDTLGFPPDRPLVVYAGRVTTAKGARLLVHAARLLPEVHFALVGKVYEYDLVELGRRAGNVTFTGFVPPAAVGRHLSAADVLAMPTDASLPYAGYTSPLKLFEYMATSRPVISSDLPAVREVLSHGRNALLFAAGDVAAFVSSVRTVIADPSLRERIARQARTDVEQFSWTARAARILEWVSTDVVPGRAS